MKNEQSILQIKQHNKILLRTIDMEEELASLESLDIMRTLDNDSIDVKPLKLKHRYIVRLNHPPDMSLLHVGGVYEVCPTIILKESKDSENNMKKMNGTSETKDDFVFFRPIFNMILTDYKINNSKNYKWEIAFEET